eukprot:2671704-Rhodomonas_salina.3
MVGSKGMRWLLLAVWFFMAGIEQGVHGIFVKFKPGESKCFIEMLRKDEVMMITYKSPDQTALPKNAPSQQNHESMMLKVTEQQGKQIFEGQTDVEGRFAFTALTDGSHNFCWRSRPRIPQARFPVARSRCTPARLSLHHLSLPLSLWILH